jgi:hypothetical protein
MHGRVVFVVVWCNAWKGIHCTELSFDLCPAGLKSLLLGLSPEGGVLLSFADPGLLIVVVTAWVV